MPACLASDFKPYDHLPTEEGTDESVRLYSVVTSTEYRATRCRPFQSSRENMPLPLWRAKDHHHVFPLRPTAVLRLQCRIRLHCHHFACRIGESSARLASLFNQYLNTGTCHQVDLGKLSARTGSFDNSHRKLMRCGEASQAL